MQVAEILLHDVVDVAVLDLDHNFLVPITKISGVDLSVTRKDERRYRLER